MSDIEAIKARLANGPEFESILPSETNELYCSFAELPYKLGEWDSVIYVPAHEDGGIPPVLTFIADAASDIAALIAEVEALRSEALTMRQWAEEAAAAENANAQELREARAEVARLRALLGLE